MRSDRITMLEHPVTPADIAAARGAAFLASFAPAEDGVATPCDAATPGDAVTPGNAITAGDAATAHSTGYDTPRLARAIAQATRKAAAWLEGTHRFPLEGEAAELLRGLIIDLALYEYGAQYDVMTDDLRGRHKDAMAFLKDVRMGRASLGGGPAASGTASGAVRVSLGRRHFADSDRGV